MPTLEIAKVDETGRARQVWRFIINMDRDYGTLPELTLNATLVEHRIETRQSLRHKWAISQRHTYGRSYRFRDHPKHDPAAGLRTWLDTIACSDQDFRSARKAVPAPVVSAELRAAVEKAISINISVPEAIDP